MYRFRDETTSKGGTLLFGDVNDQLKFTYVTVTNKYIWEFKMDKIILNNTTPFSKRSVVICPRGCSAYPNTGDVLIYGPKKDIKQINRFFGALFIPYLNRYEVRKVLLKRFFNTYPKNDRRNLKIKRLKYHFQISCNIIHKLPKIIFVINDTNFTLSGIDYVEQVIIHILSVI